MAGDVIQAPLLAAELLRQLCKESKWPRWRVQLVVPTGDIHRPACPLAGHLFQTLDERVKFRRDSSVAILVVD